MLKTFELDFPSDKSNKAAFWRHKCSAFDTQEHALWCKEYEFLRKEIDLRTESGLVKFYQAILRHREREEC